MEHRHNDTGRAHPAAIEAARDGDRQALDDLVAAYLPLVYNIVGRAMNGHPDVDDVVQDTMLRAVGNLPSLREPERFRPWLVAIAVRQVRNWWQAGRSRPAAGLPEHTDQQPDIQADFADVTVLRLELAGQRREAVEATRWLEDEERETLALWWMEAAGELTRDELAQAQGLTPHHATVRVHRIKERLEAARAILRALAASPRCAELAALLPSWDGRPNALWRKRLHRHVRDCPACALAAATLVPAEGLLGGLALVPLPVGLAARVLAATGTAVPGAPGPGSARPRSTPRPDSRTARTLNNVAQHPVAAAAATTAVLAAVVLGYTATGPESPGDTAPVVAQPSPTAEIRPTEPSPDISLTPPTKTPSPSPAEPQTTGAEPTEDAAAPQPGCDTGLDRTWADWPMPEGAAGGPAPAASYTDLGDGTVRDEVTCLIWQREAAPGTYSFTAAQDYCANLDLAGGGWHLPSRVELTSIIDTDRSGPAIDTTAFPGAQAQFFWTSSPWAVTTEPARAWIINFYEGLASNGAFQSGAYWARCVRSTDGSGGPDYEISGEQVTDPATGLTWQCGTSPTTMTAEEAIAYCAELSLGGHTWRLPGVKELATTVDETRVAPAVDPTAFPDTAQDTWYWTSTTAAADPAARWALNYEDGYTNYRDVTDGHARCVR